jgi:hypothetical protein
MAVPSQLSSTLANFLAAIAGLSDVALEGGGPPADRVKLITDVASWLAMQRTNPLIEHTDEHVRLYDLADATLRWVRNPADVDARRGFVVARRAFG